MKKYIVLSIFTAFILCGIFWTGVSVKSSIASVSVIPVTLGQAENTVICTGKVEFSESKNVYAERGAQVNEIYVEEGETVAFIGPNGAGKSTTIKMLTGILYPTKGDIKICGLTPIKDRNKLAFKIGTVFGQRSQLLPNLPLTESMEMFGAMYDMDKVAIKKRINELSELFDLKEFIKQPVRKLSLGQRMRAEIATSLIHRPKIIFLDEPTIGLDVVSKKSLRDLLLKINKEEKVTIFLTSHDTEDIQSICDRCVIINHGKIIIDTSTKQLISDYVKNKNIIITPNVEFVEFPELSDGMTYIKKSKNQVIVGVDTEKIHTQTALQELIKDFDIDDVNIDNESLENIIRSVYEKN